MDFTKQQASPDDATVAHKTELALALRIRGKSYRAIAKELGVGKSMAHHYVVTALAELREQNAETAFELRELELQRLDDQRDKLWDGESALAPEVNNALIRIAERRAKLVGLDAPTDARFGGIPNGAPIPVASTEVALHKLSLDQLAALHHLLAIADGSTPAAEAPVPAP